METTMTEGNIGNQVNRALAGGTAVGHRVLPLPSVMAGRNGQRYEYVEETS